MTVIINFPGGNKDTKSPVQCNNKLSNNQLIVLLLMTI